MVEKYMPKVGDKVRATLGENVLVGEVVTIANYELFDIALGDPRDSVVRVFDSDGWLFEQIVSVPSKFGAVIRRADGRLFSLVAPTIWWSDLGQSRIASEVTEGGFTVLFDGVDE